VSDVCRNYLSEKICVRNIQLCLTWLQSVLAYGDLLSSVLVNHSLVNRVADQDSVFADSLAYAVTPLRSLIMIPKCVRVLRSKREVAHHNKIITSSPYKRKLEMQQHRRRRKQMLQ